MPKIVGGLTPACTERAVAMYGKAIDTLVRVSAPETAELAKLLENIFRSVNIALMNEMAMLCDRMGVDVWEVADAAATKPFGFMRFTPGPGLGGHCIPLDPFYLSWRARQFDFHTEFIELAGKVNQNMPYVCREKVERALNGHSKPLRGSSVLIVGVAYKPDIDDTRESPALKLIELLLAEGCDVSYHDPHVPELRHGLRSTRCRSRRPSRAPTAWSSSPTTPRSTTPTSSRTPGSWSTSATPPGRSAARTARSSSCDRADRRRRPRLLGSERRAQHVARRGARMVLRPLGREPRPLRAAVSAGALHGRLRRSARRPDLDAIVVASSVPTHQPLGLRVLEAGKHVFVEKPLAASVDDARDLVEAAEQADRVLMVGHLLRFHPALGSSTS